MITPSEIFPGLGDDKAEDDKHMVAEMLIRVGQSGISKGVTITWMSGTWNKHMTYRSECWCYQG